MAFKYRSSYRSKFNRILSKGRIFGRKSKRAQASQIWALKKKLSTYIKRTRPETVIQNLQTSRLLDVENSTGGGIGSFVFTYPNATTIGAIQPPSDSFTGDFCRLYNILIEGVFRYVDTAIDAPPITLRLIAIQTTRSRAQDISTEDVFRRSNQASETANDVSSAIAVYGPLQTGVSSLGRILWDRRYTLQPGKVSSMKISFNLRRLTNYRLDRHGLADGGASTEAVPQGRVYLYYAFSYPNGETNRVNADVILNAKLAYPDN